MAGARPPRACVPRAGEALPPAAPALPGGLEVCDTGGDEPAARRRRGEAGFTLVMLVMILAVMSILMGAAVQSVAFQRQREKEAELIFRGGQYVEGIRIYKTRFGRFPVTLKEMWEAKPRVLRKKWQDPITESDRWGIVFLGQDGQQVGAPGAGTDPELGPQPSPSPQPTQPPDASDDGPFSGIGDRPRQVGPIVGVHSTSCDESIKTYEGRTRYCDWKFVFKEQQNQQQAGSLRPSPPPR